MLENMQFPDEFTATGGNKRAFVSRNNDRHRRIIGNFIARSFKLTRGRRSRVDVDRLSDVKNIKAAERVRKEEGDKSFVRTNYKYIFPTNISI